MTKKLYQTIASKMDAYHHCLKVNYTEWIGKHEDSILELVHNHMPSGSGIDSGTKILLDESKPDKLVFSFGYHHMNENGYYDGWTEHKAIVTPSFVQGISINITGRNRNDIKDYLYQTFEQALNQEVDTES